MFCVNVFDVNLGAVQHRIACNSDRYETHQLRAESLGFFPTGTDVRLRVDNSLPGCLLEIGDETLEDWMASSEVPAPRSREATLYEPDGVAAEFGRSAIRHLMYPSNPDVATDRLTVEALALGIAARGMAQFTCRDGDIDGEIRSWARTGRRAEIDRSIDLLESRISDPELAIQDLAKAACLSSSRFSSVFRSMVGETPYAFILRRRAEYARDLILGTHSSLAEVALASGFSSQAHMTVVVRRFFDITPAAMRRS